MDAMNSRTHADLCLLKLPSSSAAALMPSTQPQTMSETTETRDASFGSFSSLSQLQQNLLMKSSSDPKDSSSGSVGSMSNQAAPNSSASSAVVEARHQETVVFKLRAVAGKHASM